MPRGNVQHTKVVYGGKADNFVVFVDSEEDLKRWKKDPSVPLSQVVSGWKVFVTHKQGAQGILDGASNAMLDGEFGNHDEEEVVKKILVKGQVQTFVSPEREGGENPADGPMVPH